MWCGSDLSIDARRKRLNPAVRSPRCLTTTRQVIYAVVGFDRLRAVGHPNGAIAPALAGRLY
jgi:hypothetical protein